MIDKIINTANYTGDKMTRELLAKVVDSLPYPVEVFDMDGTAIYVNKTILEENHIPDPNMVIGKYNIFKDPAIVNSDYYHMVKCAFKPMKSQKLHT